MLHYNPYVRFFYLERNVHLSLQGTAQRQPEQVAQHALVPGKPVYSNMSAASWGASSVGRNRLSASRACGLWYWNEHPGHLWDKQRRFVNTFHEKQSRTAFPSWEHSEQSKMGMCKSKRREDVGVWAGRAAHPCTEALPLLPWQKRCWNGTGGALIAGCWSNTYMCITQPWKDVINSSITINGEIPLINAVKVALSASCLPEERQQLQDLAQDPWQHSAQPLWAHPHPAISKGKQLLPLMMWAALHSSPCSSFPSTGVGKDRFVLKHIKW